MAEMTKGPFSPYVNNLNEDDPLVKKVPMTKMDIGANTASMPKGMPSGPGSIEHVGSGVKGAK